MVLIIKRFLSAALSVCILCGLCPAASAETQPQISVEKAVVMSDEGEILFTKEAEERSLIASTTKLMTAILALEQMGLDRVVTARPEYCAVEGSSMYLVSGERYTVRELLQGLLLASGNDAALALAAAAAGDESAFVERMNEKAKELSLTDTHFANPHGLDAEEHYSTAADLGRLMAYCMQNETFCQLTQMKGCTVHGLTFVNHNKLLTLCRGCCGGKTGFTEAAGRCLVSCCEREGTRLICVTLDAPRDWEDHQQLYDWAFACYGQRDLTEGLCFELPVISGLEDTVSVRAEPLKLLLPKDQEVQLEIELPRYVFAPLALHEEAGRVTAVSNGQSLGEVKLFYAQSVAQDKQNRSLWNRMRRVV